MKRALSLSPDLAARAEKVVKHYSRVPGYEGEADWMADVTDLLADLRHFCQAHGLDFDELDGLAERHFEAEMAGEDEEDYTPLPSGGSGWVCPECGNTDGIDQTDFDQEFGLTILRCPKCEYAGPAGCF